jgi:hypothetical protein
VLVALAFCLIYPLASANPASAATTARAGTSATAAPAAVHLGNFTKTYKATWTFKSPNIGACVVFIATGKITYAVYYSVNDKFHLRYSWQTQRLGSPTVEADIHAYANGSCIGPGTATGMSLGQAWTGYACNFNPSLQVSIPWSLGFSFWPSCGDREQAAYDHYYPGTYTFYKQYNSGVPASFGNYDSVIPVDTKPKPPCYGLYVSGTVYERNISDSYVSGAGQVCLSQY